MRGRNGASDEFGVSNVGSPCPGRLGNDDPGHAAPAPPTWADPDHCHSTRTATVGAGHPQTRAWDTGPRLDQQRLPSAKTGKNQAGIAVPPGRALGTRDMLVTAPAPALRVLSPAEMKWELWEHHQDQEAVSPLPLTSREGAWALRGDDDETEFSANFLIDSFRKTSLSLPRPHLNQPVPDSSIPGLRQGTHRSAPSPRQGGGTLSVAAHRCLRKGQAPCLNVQQSVWFVCDWQKLGQYNI